MAPSFHTSSSPVLPSHSTIDPSGMITGPSGNPRPSASRVASKGSPFMGGVELLQEVPELRGGGRVDRGRRLQPVAGERLGEAVAVADERHRVVVARELLGLLGDLVEQ